MPRDRVRSRSIAEKELILKLVSKNLALIEPGKEKEKGKMVRKWDAWEEIRDQFNASEICTREVTRQELQRLWNSMKVRTKHDRQKQGNGPLKNRISTAMEMLLERRRKGALSAPNDLFENSPNAESDELFSENLSENSDGDDDDWELKNRPRSTKKQHSETNPVSIAVNSMYSVTESYAELLADRPSSSSRSSPPVLERQKSFTTPGETSLNQPLSQPRVAQRHPAAGSVPIASQVRIPQAVSARPTDSPYHGMQQTTVVSPVPQIRFYPFEEPPQLHWLQQSQIQLEIMRIQNLVSWEKNLHETRMQNEKMLTNWAKELHESKMRQHALLFQSQLDLNKIQAEREQHLYLNSLKSEQTLASMQEELHDIQLETQRLKRQEAETKKKMVELKLQQVELELEQTAEKS